MGDEGNKKTDCVWGEDYGEVFSSPSWLLLLPLSFFTIILTFHYLGGEKRPKAGGKLLVDLFTYVELEEVSSSTEEICHEENGVIIEGPVVTHRKSRCLLRFSQIQWSKYFPMRTHPQNKKTPTISRRLSLSKP